MKIPREVTRGNFGGKGGAVGREGNASLCGRPFHRSLRLPPYLLYVSTVLTPDVFPERTNINNNDI